MSSNSHKSDDAPTITMGDFCRLADLAMRGHPEYLKLDKTPSFVKFRRANLPNRIFIGAYNHYGSYVYSLAEHGTEYAQNCVNENRVIPLDDVNNRICVSVLVRFAQGETVAFPDGATLKDLVSKLLEAPTEKI